MDTDTDISRDLGGLLTAYNFSEISDFEFEELCRDLMQAELGLSLELFAPGPDQGIDIRYIGVSEDQDHTIVGQCKRWTEDSFTRLLRHLSRDEPPKIRKLAPQQYLLMTSVKLTPGRKNKITAALDPWIQTPKDVMGKHDISGLLARHSEVERRHIKLWLTSSEVLDALLNSDIANRSEGALEQAKRQLRLWVPNPSFTRAREILDANHVCVISGAPGIGKTMLANVLLAGYTSLGYQPVAISDDIEEGDRAWRSNVRQVFLYDDFLGQVTYGELHLRKNEQSRLALFLERVRNSENKRFILTTREYILSEALRRYERLSDAEIETYKSIVSLEDYTHLIRGRILYNHLFFTNLPSTLRTALLPEERYWDVIRHPNYNPRVIEHAVGLPNVGTLSPDEFVSNVFATLDDPTKVWEHIFENLPDVARRVLLAVASLPTEVFLDDVRDAVKGLLPRDFNAGEFRSAVSMIEGTFIDLQEARPGAGRHQRLVVVRDPSVRDYLWARLEAVDGEAEALLEDAIFFEQCVILYEGQNHANSVPTRVLRRTADGARTRQVVNHETVARRAIELIASPNPLVRRMRDEDSDYTEREPIDLERRIAFLMTVFGEHPTSQAVAASAHSGLGIIVAEWEAGRGSPSDALEMLNQVMRTEGLLHEKVLERAERSLLSLTTSRLQQREDFEVLVGLANLNPDLFAQPQRCLESWSSEFGAFLNGERVWLLEELDDPDRLGEEMRAICRIAEVLGMDIAELEADADSRIDELRIEWEPDSDDDIPELDSDPREESVEAEINALFQSLR